MIVKLVLELLLVIIQLLRAEGKADEEEEALMRAQEVLKREMDRRKFGTG